jgi:hypothetical protein
MATVFSISEPARTGHDPAWIKSLFTGSILALVLIGGVPTFQSLLRRRLKPSQSRSPWLKGDALYSLRASILGHGRKHIASMLGPPQALGNENSLTWYYALDSTDPIAMSIQFDNDHARAVEFFRSPV